MHPNGFESLDEFNYHHRLAANSEPSLVMFSSPACGTCRRVEALLPAAAPNGMQLFHVDVAASQGLAKAFDIFHLPDLFLYLDGRFHARLNCEVTPTALSRAIEQAQSAPAQDEP